MSNPETFDHVVRERLRSLRKTLRLSLDDLADRTHLSPSTISRVETGKRSISLDVLVPLAKGLGVSLDVLLQTQPDDDVVIRPTASSEGGRTTWMLSRADARTVSMKMRLAPVERRPEQRVHPGHDWFVVIQGRVRLWLGDRIVDIDEGEAAEFATMTPHAFAALDGPAEVIAVFDREGQQAHVHR